MTGLESPFANMRFTTIPEADTRSVADTEWIDYPHVNSVDKESNVGIVLDHRIAYIIRRVPAYPLVKYEIWKSASLPSRGADVTFFQTLGLKNMSMVGVIAGTADVSKLYFRYQQADPIDEIVTKNISTLNLYLELLNKDDAVMGQYVLERYTVPNTTSVFRSYFSLTSNQTGRTTTNTTIQQLLPNKASVDLL